MPDLFDPIELRGLKLPNRIIISPMCQYSAVDGNATSWHTAHLSSQALGGAGLLCLEATAVTAEGRITPGCLGLWNEANAAALAEVVNVLRASSPIKLAIQLAHAGRKASSAAPWDGGQLIAPENGGWLPRAPSALPHKDGEPPPLAMSADDLARTARAFVEAARRAVRLGFDAIELHAAHGYLLHQFLSPISNHRADEYGGSLENRMRFPLEVFQAVRAALPERMPLGVRVSATDWVDDEPSWTPEQTVAFGLRLKELGADWIDVSSGGVSPKQQIPVGPGYQVPLAELLKREVGLPTIAVGLITAAQQAQQIVAEGKADMVALARAALYDPRWAWHAAAELDRQVDGPPQYWRSLPSGKNRVFGDTSFGMR
ncbi:NADH:flavin oxidoreductase/NADH oxidase [Pollutimonas bauzanensis]|uniref:2,4-dienoyl-CoA reductase n=1 Tax=Pollutimonas bauzanensis TaxID=658167 RepID=A0A1M5V5L3_9BURK|nr:NADH:flavin oxidoreductase/NADH oxidase [Pollutimonas bauzanensis]SHH70480.1 2,4-dienoyl-CoA reductase [Pollutimonas bauzanensis]